MNPSPSESGSNDPTVVPRGEMRFESTLAGPHLLFGIIALQNNLITREQLVAAFETWIQNKSSSLGEILVASGALTGDLHDLLSRLVAMFLQRHGGDPERSLASLSSVPQLRQELERLADADLAVSLGHVGTAIHLEEAAEKTAVIKPNDQTGRFRILRLHSKGGLGQVSVALDRELNREVAFKEILERHSDDAVARERFVLEAEITGGLEHPGIVPVYALGHSADGRPFYAMRFIKGDSLKQAIEQFHKSDRQSPGDPNHWLLGLRPLLRRFVDICNAVEYAHSRGVLHRDLKPGNVMIGGYGETLVVDWGLAKAIGTDEVTSADPALRPLSALSSLMQTQPGSAIGTPAYMSPEQAAGKLDDLGPATDVYSLGATLFHLLTGRAPFAKENVSEILQKVQKGQFESPRMLVPQVPRALEAICLKSMALKPSDRYPTAKSLADDVENWLADEPVTALPETFVSTAARWLRKHRAWTLSGSAALIVIAIVAGIAAVWINSARVRAQTNFQIARAAVNDLLTDMAQEKLIDEPGMTEIRRDLLEKAKSYNQVFLDQQEQDPELRLQTGHARQLVADIQRILSNYEDAEIAYQSALKLLEPLVHEQPNLERATQYLAECHTQLGEVYRLTSRPDEADRSYLRSQKLTEDLVKRSNRPEFRKELAQIHDNRGILFKDSNRPKEALSEFQQAIDLLKALMSEFPQEPMYPQRVARGYLNSGPPMLKTGLKEEAESNYQMAISLQKKLIEQFPRKPDYQSDLAASYNNLGRLHRFLKQPELAIENFSRSIELLERLADRFPGVRLFRRELARVKNNLAGILANHDKVSEAEKHLTDAEDLCRRLIGEDPEVPDFHYGLAETLDNLGWLVLFRKPQPIDFARAQTYLEEGVREIILPFERNQESVDYRGVQNDVYKYLAQAQLGLMHHADAALTAQILSRFVNDDENPHFVAASVLSRCAVLAQADQELPEADRQAKAREYLDQAMKQLRDAVLLKASDLQSRDLDALRIRDDFKALESTLRTP